MRHTYDFCKKNVSNNKERVSFPFTFQFYDGELFVNMQIGHLLFSPRCAIDCNFNFKINICKVLSVYYGFIRVHFLPGFCWLFLIICSTPHVHPKKSK